MGRSKLSVVHGLIALVFLLFTPHLSVAQITGIAGLVRDTSGGVLPGVTVEASSPALIEKVRSAVTDAQGLYRIVDLRPGVVIRADVKFHDGKHMGHKIVVPRRK